MAITLRQSDADFEQRFAAFLLAKREVSPCRCAVRDIVRAFAPRSDAALIDYCRKLTMPTSEVSALPSQRTTSPGLPPTKTIEALEFARDRIRSHHERQRPRDDRYTDAAGVELGWRWTAIEAVGLYVPGGTASYPSSVLMNAIPAGVAGVERIVMVVPAPGGIINPLVLVAADIQVSRSIASAAPGAIPPLAYGTETSNLWPRRARHVTSRRPSQVFGTVGIGDRRPRKCSSGDAVTIRLDAADLLAQAETTRRRNRSWSPTIRLSVVSEQAVERRCRACRVPRRQRRAGAISAR